MRLGRVSIIVRDYDEAIDWYRAKLGFQLLEDTPLTSQKRWVVMAPPSGPEERAGAEILLAKAANDAQAAFTGDQTGGRVFLFLYTNNFAHDYRRMREAGVAFVEEPRIEPYGQVVVFTDLYGNKWDFIEPR